VTLRYTLFNGIFLFFIKGDPPYTLWGVADGGFQKNNKKNPRKWIDFLPIEYKIQLSLVGSTSRGRLPPETAQSQTA
jgi:hypothetical protein